MLERLKQILHIKGREKETGVYDRIDTLFFSLNEDIILYMLINGDIINDLGLKDVQIFINPVYIDHIPINEYLSKELESFEESYAEDWYCFIHDL